MDTKTFLKWLKRFGWLFVAFFTAQGMLTAFVDAKAIQLRSVVLLIHNSYTAVVTDNLRALGALFGLSPSRAAADYFFIFVAFTLPLVASAFALRPKKEELAQTEQKSVWVMTTALAILLVGFTFTAGQNVLMAVVSPKVDAMLSAQLLWGLPIRYMTIGFGALTALYLLWRFRNVGEEEKRRQRRAAVFRTLLVFAIAAALILLNRFVTW